MVAGFVPVIERCRQWLLGHVCGDWRLFSAVLLCAMHAIATAMLSRPRPLLGRALVQCACRGQSSEVHRPCCRPGLLLLMAFAGEMFLVGGALLQACLAIAATASWGHALTGDHSAEC